MNSLALSMTRRQWAMLLGVAAFAGSAHAAGGALPVPTSLPDELAAALKHGSPLLVMVSLDGCPYCKVARENFLVPLQGQAGLRIVQLDMRHHEMVQDFSGTRQTQDQLIRNWGVKVAPTVLFFGRGGKEVAERLVGGYIADFYSDYLEDRLHVARAAVAG